MQSMRSCEICCRQYSNYLLILVLKVCPTLSITQMWN